MSPNRLAGTIKAKQLSLCSSRNRALSVEDKDVGVKPTGGSRRMPDRVYILCKKTDVVRFHFRAGARQRTLSLLVVNQSVRQRRDFVPWKHATPVRVRAL